MKNLLLNKFKKFMGQIGLKELDEPIKFEDLIDKNSKIVKAIVFIYTMETFIPY